MSNAFVPTRKEIGDPFAAMERVRQIRAKMYPTKSPVVVIPLINRPTKKPGKQPKGSIVRDIINLENNADLEVPEVNVTCDGPPISEPEKMTAKRIIKEVALEYGLTPNDIKSHRKNAYLVEARFKCFWRMKKETLFSLPMMGRLIGGRDHSTGIHAIRKYEARMREGSHERQLRMYGPVHGATVTVVK